MTYAVKRVLAISCLAFSAGMIAVAYSNKRYCEKELDRLEQELRENDIKILEYMGFENAHEMDPDIRRQRADAIAELYRDLESQKGDE